MAACIGRRVDGRGIGRSSVAIIVCGSGDMKASLDTPTLSPTGEREEGTADLCA
jgi:hypothetical protein